MGATFSSHNSRHWNNAKHCRSHSSRRRKENRLKQILKKITSIIAVLVLMALATSCGSKISRININGTYKGSGIMGYEAVVTDGTITIYSTSFFEREVFWYGTCISSEMNEENIILSRRLATNDEYSFFGFGSMNRSGASEKEILFTENSLTFIYDMAGMAVQRVTLQKVEAARKRYNDYDSNAEKADPNYKDPTIPLPPPPGQTERPTEPPTTEAPKSDIIIPEGDNISL